MGSRKERRGDRKRKEGKKAKSVLLVKRPDLAGLPAPLTPDCTRLLHLPFINIPSWR